MCIRAIDYCPPVDITFGDFLRGIVTADLDYSPADRSGYRVVFVESFREWGIYPRGIRSMGLDALVWPTGDELAADLQDPQARNERKGVLRDHLRNLVLTVVQNWNLESSRYQVWRDLDGDRIAVWQWLKSGDSYGRDYARLFGLELDNAKTPATVFRRHGVPTAEIQVRPALRRSPDGGARTDLAIEITQARLGYFDPKTQERIDRHKPRPRQKLPKADFVFRAGCTVLIDPRTAEVRRVMKTPGTIADNDELERVRGFLTGQGEMVGNAFDANLPESMSLGDRRLREEPFAFLHQLEED